MNHRPPLPTTKEVVKVVKEGWHDKAKGSFQILWERGHIDESKKGSYTVSGSKDKDGIVNKEFSLNDVIRKCYDFVNEPTMLQFIGEENLALLLVEPQSALLNWQVRELNILGQWQRVGTAYSHY